jgi:hypothetical protein
VNNFKRVLLSIIGFLGASLLSAQTTFTSIHVFGDGVCTTTDNTAGAGPLYHGNRYCNGRVWIEVLSQWQGLVYVEANNDSFFEHDSDALLLSVAAHSAPVDVTTALYIVWSHNADFVEFLVIDPPDPDYDDASHLVTWTALIEEAVQNHEDAITDLYSLGVRTLVLPNAVDVTAAPNYNLSMGNRDFVRARVNQYNVSFNAMLTTLVPTLAGLKVHLPDTYEFFEEVLAKPGNYGVTNTNIDAINDLYPPSFTGPGASYLFWDPFHPTAKVQMHLAALVQHVISPEEITGISAVVGGCELEVSNVPVGRDGVVEGSGDLLTWVEEVSFSSVSVVQEVTVPSTDPMRFFRVQFPVVWTWP